MKPLRAVERGLFALGLAGVGIFALGRLQAGLYQALEGARLDRSLARHASGAGGPKSSMGIIGRLTIPRLRISVIVKEGVDAGTLLLAAGHLPGTALPGEPGNVVVAAHRDSFFRELRHVRPGDPILFVTPEGSFDYRVESTQIVSPARTDLLEPSDSPKLTLVTCYPFDFVGRAPQRFIVQARPLEATGAQVSASGPTPVSD